LTVCKQPPCDRPRYGALPRSGLPVQPVDGWLAKVPCPEFDIVQNGSACSSETTVVLAMLIPGPSCAGETIEDRLFGYRSFTSDACHPERRTFRPSPCREGSFDSFGHERGNTHHELASLIVSCHLLHGLLSWSLSRSVLQPWTNHIIADSLL